MGKGYSDFFYIEDNSPVHGKKRTRQNRDLYTKIRVEYFIYSIDWPPKSPDLNLIKNIWRVIKRKLRNGKPHGGWSLEDLRSAVLDIWEHEITPEIYNKWIDELPDRLQAVIDRKGDVTKY